MAGAVAFLPPVLSPFDRIPLTAAHHCLGFLRATDVLSFRSTSPSSVAVCRELPELHIMRSLNKPEVVKIFRMFGSAQSINLYRCTRLTPACLNFIISGFDRPLRELLLRQASLQDEQARLVIRAFPNLERLALSGSSFFEQATIGSIAMTFRGLADLDLGGCRTLDDEGVATLVSNMSHMVRLWLDGCTALRCPVIASRCLLEVSLSECASLHGPVFTTPLLKRINASNCRMLTDAGVEAMVAACPKLGYLNLSGCHSLTRPTIISHSLIDLNLGLCTQLIMPTIECHSLLVLDLGMCSSLRFPTLDLPSIRTLDLSMLGFLSLTLRAAQLRVLNLCGNRKLLIEGCDIDCPLLREVHVNGCAPGLKALAASLGQELDDE